MKEISTNLIGEGTRLEGTLHFTDICRVQGVLIGEVHASDASTLIFEETSVVEGNIHADTLMIQGYVQGNIIARKKVLVSSSGRVIGTIKTPTLMIEAGAYFEGSCNSSPE